jgi:hypothetical protein
MAYSLRRLFPLGLQAWPCLSKTGWEEIENGFYTTQSVSRAVKLIIDSSFVSCWQRLSLQSGWPLY